MKVETYMSKQKLYRVKYNGHWCRYFSSVKQAGKFACKNGGRLQIHNPFAIPSEIERDEFGEWVDSR